MNNNLCKCGCGEPVTVIGNRFILGHSRKGLNIKGVIALREQHPDWTQVAIAKEIGITKVRVGQILKEYNLSLLRTKDTVPCKLVSCNAMHTRGNGYCSATCKRVDAYFLIPCAFCFKSKKVNKTKYIWATTRAAFPYSGMVFCNKTCQGKWLGTNFSIYNKKNDKTGYCEISLKDKDMIRDIYNFYCQRCGMTNQEHLIHFGHQIHIHHIDSDPFNNEPINLTVLCLSCNRYFSQHKEESLDFPYGESI